MTQQGMASLQTQAFSNFQFGDQSQGGPLSFQDFPSTANDGYLQFDSFSQAMPASSGFSNPASLAADSLGNGLSQLHFDEGVDEDDLASVPEQLPEYACAYCHIHNPACVVKCLSTGKWFCNGRVNSAGSCIVLHLVKSRHKEVQLHRDSPLGDTVLECYATSSRNVFVLGFVPVKSGNTVVLLGRETPPNHLEIKNLDLDLQQWQPIIENRGLVSWLVKVPSEQEMLRARHLTMEQVTRLEEVWRARPEAGLEEVESGPGGLQTEVMAVAKHYDDAAQYMSVFEPLIKLEADHDRRMKESQGRDNITVRWDKGLNQKWLAKFNFPRDDSDLNHINIGDMLILKHKCPGNRAAWEASGHVVPSGDSEDVSLELKKGEVPEDCTVGYSVEFVWKGTTYERMRNSLTTFRKYSASISGYLYHVILGQTPEPATLKIPIPKSFNVPTLPELNHSQLHAVKSVLTQPLSLIQGPPGTGKTITSAAIVYHLAHSGTGQVLVAAPSNVAVDHLAAKIDATGLKVVRLCAKTREAVASPVEHLTLHYQVQNLKVPEAETLRSLLKLSQEHGGLMAAEERQVKMLRRKLEMEVLDHADVVCCTCVGAGDPRLSNSRFQHVLIDESTQATECECLIPLVLGAKQVILVGDHCQLGPVIMCKQASEAGLCQSLFERLRLLDVKPVRLTVQYRMHPCLSVFPSNTFYEGTLQNGTGVGDRVMKGLDFPWPNPDKPMMFYVQLGLEEMSGSATSFLNRTEATNVEKVVTRLLTNGLSPSQIGVITPYEGQRAHVVSVMLRNGTQRQELYKEIEVSSVDAFQGREKDIIVLSCVRSNEQQSIGFLSDPRRLNVALTRAKYGLIILGNPRVLSKQPLWNSLLSHFKENGCLVEGPLTNLKQSMVQLSRPKMAFDRSSFGVGGGVASNRFMPSERVGDPVPSRAPPSGHNGDRNTRFNDGPTFAVGPGDGTTGKQGFDRSRLPSKGGFSAAANGKAAGFPVSSQQAPYAVPSYAIPSANSRTGFAKHAPGARASLHSQDMGGSQSSLGSAAPFTQGGGPATQPTGSEGGHSLGGVAPGVFNFTSEFSQASYGLGGVGDEYSSQGDGFMLSQGFNETQFLDAATGEVYADHT